MQIIWGLLLTAIAYTECAVLDKAADEIEEEGLYKSTDHVVILGAKNFDKKLYGEKHAWLLQFYNSFCGHCRNFMPVYKQFAEDITPWATVIRPAVIDCSVEANIDYCRNFDVMQYPSLRYLQPNYEEGNNNHGDPLKSIDAMDSLKQELIEKLQKEQSAGQLNMAPWLGISGYKDFEEALGQLSKDSYGFLIFESLDSVVGPQLILDTHDYMKVQVKRVLENSRLAEIVGVHSYPSLIAVQNKTNKLQTRDLTPRVPTKQALLIALNAFLSSENYVFPPRNIVTEEVVIEPETIVNNTHQPDVVYYSDLETTLRFLLHIEVTRLKTIKGEALQALIGLLDVLIKNFVFKNINLRNYLIALKNDLQFRSEWTGKEIEELILRHENTYSPVYITNLEYIGCKGSQPNYRGYSCGLWTLFHTLTVNADNKSGAEGPRVLQAMHGFIKNFFGCTTCVQHFTQMAARNKLFDIQQNDKAVLWLWISHNEVNLRLAGDKTEDPQHPKIQFPTPQNCPKCRSERGAWDLPAVYEHLHKVYTGKNIRSEERRPASASAPSFSKLDIGLLSIPYIFSFVIILFALKLYLTKKFYRKRNYKHDGWGKV